MKKAIASFLFLLFCLISVQTFAQSDSGFKETMRSNGRIYVVVAVILTILAGLVLYLVRLDRRVSRMEEADAGPR